MLNRERRQPAPGCPGSLQLALFHLFLASFYSCYLYNRRRFSCATTTKPCLVSFRWRSTSSRHCCETPRPSFLRYAIQGGNDGARGPPCYSLHPRLRLFPAHHPSDIWARHASNDVVAGCRIPAKWRQLPPHVSQPGAVPAARRLPCVRVYRLVAHFFSWRPFVELRGRAQLP